MSDNGQDNFKRFETLLSYDPLKNPKANKSMLDDVAKEFKEARDKKAREMVKQTMEAAHNVHKQAGDIDKQYRQQRDKLNKEMGKLMGILEAVSKGAEAPAEGGDEPTVASEPAKG